MMSQARHIVVHGSVQGVGFRYFVRGVATRLGLTGNVRNLGDGTVDIVVEGDPASLAELIKSVRKGPGPASVERVDVEEIPAGKYRSFLVEGR
jgi:acylphosphatase